MTKPGIFIFSLDVELAWGVFERGLDRYEPSLRKEREAIWWLLAELETRQLAATWAMVGHLLLSSCRREGDDVHPEVMRAAGNGAPRRWDSIDPATDVARDPLWYGSDVLERILAARVRHEIATHTFSHLDTRRQGCSREVLRSELAKCRELHRQHGVALESIVFPRNHVAHLDVLAEVGIRCYRGREEHWYEALPEGGRRAFMLAQRIVGLTPPTYPRSHCSSHGIQAGVTNLPASMFLFPREGSRKAVSPIIRTRQALAGVRRAAERAEVVHLWLHPYNLVTDPSLYDTCRAVFAEVTRWAEKGRLTPLTMARAAETLSPPAA